MGRVQRRTSSSVPDEVFLSHSSRDHRIAQHIVAVLTRHGINVWFAPRNIRGAQQWHDEIGGALRRCNWFVVLLSPHSVKSKWVKRELLYALQDDRYENHILCLRIAPCDHAQLSWTLGAFQHIDFSLDFETACREMLRVWGLGYQSSSS